MFYSRQESTRWRNFVTFISVVAVGQEILEIVSLIISEFQQTGSAPKECYIFEVQKDWNKNIVVGLVLKQLWVSENKEELCFYKE